MKNTILVFRTTTNPKRIAGVRAVNAAFQARKVIVAVLALAVFVATAQAGISTITSVGQISLQILVQVCRLVFAALQIFGK